MNNQHGPAMKLDCTGDWARCSGSQSYLLTEINIQIYSAATAAIPTVISQLPHRHSACLSSLSPHSLSLVASLVLICFFFRLNRPATPFFIRAHWKSKINKSKEVWNSKIPTDTRKVHEMPCIIKCSHCLGRRGLRFAACFHASKKLFLQIFISFVNL